MSALDIIEQQLRRMEVTVEQMMPYQWTAKARLDRMIFQGNGFTPGQAMDVLYSVMLRHLDQQEAVAK